MHTTASRTVAVVSLGSLLVTGATACRTPPAPPSNTPAGMPVIRGCDELVPAQTAFEFNESFSADESYQPAVGTLAADAAELGGVACAWVDESSGEVMSVAVANPSGEELASREGDAGRAASAFAGYFTADNNVAQAQAFTGPYWVIVDTSFAADENELAPIVDSVLESLAN